MRKYDDGNFATDDVEEWLSELEGTKNVSVLEDACSRVMSERGHTGPSVYSIGIAAAEVVAALRGRPAKEVPREVRAFVKRVSTPPSPDLLALALAAITRIKAKAESQELWDEGTICAAWHQTVADVETRLK
jgi:hypothetical protein